MYSFLFFIFLYFLYSLACGMTVRRRRPIEQCKAGTLREKSYATFQPWKVAIVKRQGNGQKPKIMCSGVLINEQWVLTGTKDSVSASNLDVVTTLFGRRFDVVTTLFGRQQRCYNVVSKI